MQHGGACEIYGVPGAWRLDCANATVFQYAPKPGRPVPGYPPPDGYTTGAGAAAPLLVQRDWRDAHTEWRLVNLDPTTDFSVAQINASTLNFAFPRIKGHWS